MVEKNKKTAPEIIRFQGLWSEMGDSNSRHLAPKASALPTALIPDFWLLSFAPDVVKHVVTAIFDHLDLRRKCLYRRRIKGLRT